MSVRWDDKRSPAALAFLQELAEVCQKHGFVLGHEDHHGAFEIYPLQPGEDHDWLLNATEHVKDESASPGS